MIILFRVKLWTDRVATSLRRKGKHVGMYVHIGGEYSISTKYLIGIFDFDGTTGSGSATIDFLKRMEREGFVEAITEDLPRSFLVTVDRVYLSPVSAATLRLRLMEQSQVDVRSRAEEER